MKKKNLIAVIVILTLLAFGAALSGCQKAEVPQETQPVKQGLAVENGDTYFYNEDGSLFTGGYKEVSTETGTDYYYFLPNAKAFSTGYKAVELDGSTCHFFFEADGTAFTGGFKEVTIGDSTYLYYFGEDGKALTGCWFDTSETSFFFDESGRALKDCFHTVEGDLYYFDDQCAPVTGGWFCLEDGYYYADEKGVLATDTVVDGYKLDAAGKSATKYRIIEYVNEHTDPAMTQQEKIDALYNWVLTNDMSYIRSYEHVKADWVWHDGWVDDMAASLMDEWGGNCYRYAAFLGLLLREATELPVTVYYGETPGLNVDLTPHGWPAVCQEGEWYIYDVEMDKYTEYDSSGCYKVLASESPLHLQGVGTDLYH